MSEALAPSLRVRPATVAVVGRPNVGKSALFNRLLGQRLAIVEDTPGVTRDRLYALAEWRSRSFTLVDTGGIETEVDPRRRDRARDPRASGDRPRATPTRSCSSSTRIDGLTPVDQDVADILRRTRHPVLLVANKIESPKRAARRSTREFGGLGFGEPHGVSAMHGEGTGDLLDAIVDRLPPEDPTDLAEAELALALIGQPNVGKSSLLNALLNEERAIVSDVPGTTRDAIDTLFTWSGGSSA